MQGLRHLTAPNYKEGNLKLRIDIWRKGKEIKPYRQNVRVNFYSSDCPQFPSTASYSAHSVHSSQKWVMKSTWEISITPTSWVFQSPSMSCNLYMNKMCIHPTTYRSSISHSDVHTQHSITCSRFHTEHGPSSCWHASWGHREKKGCCS